MGIKLVKDAMPRNRYQEIKSVFHLADNNEAMMNKGDKGFKVRPLMNKLNHNFEKWGILDKCLSIDDMIVRYYGHFSLKQFIRGKPIRFGYKLWALCGSDGDCYNFDLDCGRDNSASCSEPLGTRVVKKMLSVVEDPNSHIFFYYNFFTSHSLLAILREMGFRASSTIRENRTARCPLEINKILEKKNPQRVFRL